MKDLSWDISIREFRYVAGAPPILKDLNLTLRAGRLHRVIGPSGCGKSTLLGILAGRLPSPASSQVLAADLESLRQTRVTRSAQDPYLGLATTQVIDELLLGPEFQETSIEVVLARVRETVHELQLHALVQKSTDELSFGEARLISLATIWQYPSPILLLDEPLAGLDSRRRLQAARVLTRMLEAGCTVVLTDISESGTADFAPDETLIRLAPLPSESAPEPPKFSVCAARNSLTLDRACWQSEHREPGYSVQVDPGSLLLLIGPNGCGKTRLLQALAGMTRLRAGAANVSGLTAYASANPDQQIYAPDVRTEWMTGCRHPPAEGEALLRYLGLEIDPTSSPLLLSFGQKKRLILVSALVRGASHLLLDEPLSGLDQDRRRRFLELLRAFLRGGGIAVIATHEPEIFSEWRPQVLDLGRPQENSDGSAVSTSADAGKSEIAA